MGKSSMEKVIKTRIVKIGNSQGLRIPKVLLDQTGLGGDVELEVHQDTIVIRNARHPGDEWEKQFAAMGADDDATLLEETSLELSSWDATEWEW